MKIAKNDIVTMKDGKKYKVIKITKHHVDLQKASESHLPPMCTGYKSWNLQGGGIYKSFWECLASVN